MAEITRIADLRANFEKANAKMLLSPSAALGTEQCTKLQSAQQLVIRIGRMQNFLDHERSDASGLRAFFFGP